MRLTASARALLLYGVAVHIHHRFHGPPIDYAGLALASAASGLGGPGPGEPLLIAAGVLAANHRLDLASVIVSAWAGNMGGGVVGWLIGVFAGRRVLTAPGPLRRMRRRAVEKGDAIFERFTVIAVILTPAFVAGIHHVRALVFLPANALSAALWALPIGLGAYFVGPSVIDMVNDVGTGTSVAIGVVIVAAVAVALVRRRRRRRTPTGGSDPDPTGQGD